MREPAFWILTAPACEPRHRYGIIQQAAALSGGRVTLQAGTLYAALDRLTRSTGKRWHPALLQARRSPIRPIRVLRACWCSGWVGDGVDLVAVRRLRTPALATELAGSTVEEPLRSPDI